MAENLQFFSKFGKGHTFRDSRNYVNSNQQEPKENTPRHIRAKLLKLKTKQNIKISERKMICYLQRKLHLNYMVGFFFCLFCFSSKTMEARRKWYRIFQMLKKRTCHT